MVTLAPEGPVWDRLWLNGAFVATPQAKVSALDAGLLVGRGLFETLRYQGGLWRGLEHLARLRDSGAQLGLPEPADLLALPEISEALMTQLGAREAAIRWTWTAGDGGGPTLLVQARPLPSDLGRRRRGSAGVSRVLERPLATFKTTSWLAMDHAVRHAAQAAPAAGGAPVEPILVGHDGAVLEGARTNVFALYRGVFFTPPLDGRILPGTTRAALLRVLRELGRPAEERPLDLEALRRADGVFLTSSLLGVAPLRSLDGAPLGAAPLPPGLAQELRLNALDAKNP